MFAMKTPDSSGFSNGAAIAGAGAEAIVVLQDETRRHAAEAVPEHAGARRVERAEQVGRQRRSTAAAREQRRQDETDVRATRLQRRRR